MRVGAASDAPLPGVAVRTDMFADATIWKKPGIYRNALVFTQACGRVSVIGKVVASGTYDTAWGLAMKPQPPPAKILKGPAADALGYPSISLLVKRHAGFAYVITVNGTLEDITAELDLGMPGPEAEVLWENRRVPLAGGRLKDAFAPYAVHVYRIELKGASGS